MYKCSRCDESIVQDEIYYVFDKLNICEKCLPEHLVKYAEVADYIGDELPTNITHILHKYGVDFFTEKELGVDMIYRCLIKSVKEATAFNYAVEKTKGNEENA